MTTFVIIMVVLSIAFPVFFLSIYAHNQIASIKDEKAKKGVRAKWQVLFGILGAVAAIAMFIIIFTMF